MRGGDGQPSKALGDGDPRATRGFVAVLEVRFLEHMNVHFEAQPTCPVNFCTAISALNGNTQCFFLLKFVKYVAGWTSLCHRNLMLSEV